MQADDGGIDFLQAPKVEPQLRRHVAAQVVDHGMRVLHQRMELLSVLLEIERDALFPEIETLEVLAVVLAEKARSGVPGDVTAGRGVLDLDHFRAEAGEEHGAVGAGADVLDREDADALERLHSFFSR